MSLKIKILAGFLIVGLFVTLLFYDTSITIEGKMEILKSGVILVCYIFSQCIVFNKIFSHCNFYSNHKLIVNVLAILVPYMWDCYYMLWECSHVKNCEGFEFFVFLAIPIYIALIIILTSITLSIYDYLLKKRYIKQRIIDAIGITTFLLILWFFLSNTVFYYQIYEMLKDPNACGKLPNQESVDSCYFERVDRKGSLVKNSDIIFCEKIAEKEKRDRCIYIVAAYNANVYLCEKITDDEVRSDCYQSANAYRGNPIICEKIIMQKELRDECFLKTAVNKADSSLCVSITNPEIKNDCFENVSEKQRDIATKKQDETLCEDIIDHKWKDNCYLNMAIEKEDFSLCEKIVVINIKDKCYLHECYYNVNTKVCEKITDQKIKDVCYLHVAIEKKDISVCEKITYDYYKNICYTKTH